MKTTLILIFLFFSAFAESQTKKITPQELATWQQIGKGQGMVTHGQFYMAEYTESKGFMVLSPEKYEDVVLRYEVMTLNPATVLVAILNASDIGSSTNLGIANNSDNFGFWTKEVEDYMFGFRVMAHNTTPFIRKHPATNDNKGIIGLAQRDYIRSGWRHWVECGKKGKKVWLKIDGETVIDVVDDKPLGAGKIAIRVRGTADELGKSLIRNLEIIGEPLK